MNQKTTKVLKNLDEIICEKGMPVSKKRKICVKRSGVHGRGVYAERPIEAGELIIEYKGERVSWLEAQRRHQDSDGDPYHTFLFQLNEDVVIDGGSKGNMARWINHSCEPNCEAQEDAKNRIFIVALRPLSVGEELFYDYALDTSERKTKSLQVAYACFCGAPSCRGTLLKIKKKRVKK